MSVESAQYAVGTPDQIQPYPSDTPNLAASISSYGHYYTSPDPPALLGPKANDIPLNLSFEIVEDDEGIFISKAAAVWQGAIPKRAIIPLPVRVRTKLAAGNAHAPHDHAAIAVPKADSASSPDTSCASHDMEICTDEVAAEHRGASDGRGDVFQSISATPGLRGWSFEELRTECYSQSRLATGRAPRAVSHDAPSWMIIPPAFTPYSMKT